MNLAFWLGDALMPYEAGLSLLKPVSTRFVEPEAAVLGEVPVWAWGHLVHQFQVFFGQLHVQCIQIVRKLLLAPDADDGNDAALQQPCQRELAQRDPFVLCSPGEPFNLSSLARLPGASNPCARPRIDRQRLPGTVFAGQPAAVQRGVGQRSQAVAL